MTTLGVLGDTHVPDRVPQLNLRVFEIFQQAKVDAILHTGDVSTPGLLIELQQLAPVHAVQGNRDIFYLRDLPLRIHLNFEGVSIGLVHGHGTFTKYLADKVQQSVRGKHVEKYIKRMLDTFPDADVIVFGHLHTPCNFHLEGKLLFNPGSTSYPWPRSDPATVGLLYLSEGKQPQGEIIPLD
jgi:putative phosphoesterase